MVNMAKKKKGKEKEAVLIHTKLQVGPSVPSHLAAGRSCKTQQLFITRESCPNSAGDKKHLNKMKTKDHTGPGVVLSSGTSTA